MCKLMIMSGITDETNQLAWEFTRAMAIEMSNPHCAEKDGLGYAAIDPEGNLFGERWVNNRDAFKNKNKYGTEIDGEVLRRFKILNREQVYGNFGVFNENIRSITLHSRMSTNDVNYKNTHPFVEGHTSVVHNGVIYNDDKLTKKTSTCDSEVILHEYVKYNVANKPGKFKKIANRLEGYYALGIFSKTNQGQVILDIIKDSSAKLEAFFIKELNTLVFATPKFNESPVEAACKTLGLTIISKYDVKSNRLQRLDALTGETIGYESFKPKEYTKTYAPVGNWRGDEYPYAGYGSGYDVYGNNDKNFRDVFLNTKTHSHGGSNVIEMPTHSKAKHDDIVKERMLEEMVIESKVYSVNDVEKLMQGESVIEQLEDVTKEFNDDTETEWFEDDKFVWHKKTLA